MLMSGQGGMFLFCEGGVALGFVAFGGSEAMLWFGSIHPKGNPQSVLSPLVLFASHPAFVMC